jgi:Carboxypeptidase regulatory-like domain
MATPKKLTLLLSALVLVAVLAYLLLTSKPAVEPERAPLLKPQPTVFEPAPRGVEVSLPSGTKAAGVEALLAPSTVLWPLEVELNLLRSSDLPAVPSGPPLGSGRTCRLTGRIGDERGQGAAATVRFVAGSNTGRELSTDKEGRYGASDLYPGLNVVEVTGPGLLGARREVRTSTNQESEFNLGFGRPGSVSGRIFDDVAKPVVGATVRVDGHLATTNTDGIFYVDRCAPGRVLVEITHPGYAPLRQVLGVTQNFALTHERVSYRLERAAALQINFQNLVGPAGDTRVYVLPANVDYERRFDWSRYSNLTANGPSFSLFELPPGPAKVLCYRAGAISVPRVVQTNLISGETTTLNIRFDAAPVVRGRVIDDGKLVRGARVRLLAADPPGAFLRHTNIDMLSYESEVFPVLPAMADEFLTDEQGAFLATSWSETSPWRLLEALSPDGQKRALRAVGPAEEEVELELMPIEAGSAELVFELPARRQALPVDVRLNGKPSEVFELPPDQPLSLSGLAPGIWSLELRWYDQRLLRELEVDLAGTVRREVPLPAAAIEGQDEATWERAGRPYPL